MAHIFGCHNNVPRHCFWYWLVTMAIERCWKSRWSWVKIGKGQTNVGCNRNPEGYLDTTNHHKQLRMVVRLMENVVCISNTVASWLSSSLLASTVQRDTRWFGGSRLCRTLWFFAASSEQSQRELFFPRTEGYWRGFVKSIEGSFCLQDSHRFTFVQSERQPKNSTHVMYTSTELPMGASKGARIGRFDEMASRYRELLSYMDQVGPHVSGSD